ncbi:MAG: RluA family pseudouridine synthase [Myxococcales bacterium]|nr:RluA family pseudouridine synthase [Myxococcales bacterium]
MTIRTRGATLTLIRALAVANLGLAAAATVLLVAELRGQAFEAAITEGGALAVGVAVLGLMVLPALLAAWIGVGLWRLDRAAWVAQVAAGVAVPLACVAFWAVGLAEGPWAWILPALAGLFAGSLLVLTRRAGRWAFGIGPDAVLAEIHARGETTTRDLATTFAVPLPVIEALLEQTIAHGAFAGAWDRVSGKVYSVATVLTRDALRRCPRCGAAIDALGNIARCAFCGTEFAQLRGLDHPMPTPIGVCVLTAFDRVLAYVAAFLGLTWAALFVASGLRPTGAEGEPLVWGLFVVTPIALAMAALAIGKRLQAGRRGAWIAQQLLLPPAAPYLLSRRVRTLFASGLEPLRDQLRVRGELPFRELATFLKVKSRHAEELAIHLTATGTLDSVLDWHGERLLHRDQLGVDGRGWGPSAITRRRSARSPSTRAARCWSLGTRAAPCASSTSRRRVAARLRRANSPPMHEWKVSPDLDGERLDRALGQLAGLSRAQAKRLTEEGQVRVDGRRAPKGARVRAGQTLALAEAPEPADFDALPEPDAPLAVRYEDAHVVVVDKPPGQPSHPLRARELGTLANALVARYPEMAGVGYRRREPGLVHRLDTGTSGLLLCARDAATFERLRDALRAGAIDKRYAALCVGEVRAPQVVDLPIVHRTQRLMGTSDALDALDARTEILERRPARFIIDGRAIDGSIIEARATHARRHQVRVHLAALGHPLLGDTDYGGPTLEGLERHALHASRLRFEGPAGPIDVDAPWPEDLRQLLDAS